MAQQVRRGYRNHRKAAWGLAIFLAVAIAAVVIPIASGASDKTYTMLFPSAGAVTPPPPSPPTTGSATAQMLCAGNSYTSVRVQITNTAKSSSLGSANITFPSNVTLTGAPSFVSGAPGAATITKSGNLVMIRQLSLAKNAVVTVSVALDAAATAGSVQQITAVVKQSNDFNDSGQNPDANVFATPATFPTLQVLSCTTTISGRVYLDNDGDGTYDGTGTPADAGQSSWSVYLYNTSSANQVGDPIVTPATGLYTFTDVPMGSNYKVCVKPPTGSGTWGQTTPTGNTACSTVASALPAGQQITDLQGPAADKDFGVEQTITPSCTTTFSAPLIGLGDGVVDYTAQLTAPPLTTGCKGAIVMYSYLDSSGTPYATIHPPATSTDTTDYWVVERLRWKMDNGGAQNPVTLRYDDSKPYGSNMSTMKMCTADPRLAGEDFQLAVNPATVMPPGTNADGVAHTTCMIQSTDLSSGATYNYEAYTVSIVDGLKGPT